jgi:hypothetical protein
VPIIQIIGVDHWLQEYEPWTRREYVLGEPSDEEVRYRIASKETFYNLVEGLIKNGHYSLIGEECSAGQDTIPRRLAEENSLRYVEIDMSRTERDEAGIAPTYQAVPELELQGYELREDHMFAKTMAELSADQDAIVICGAIHVCGLQKRFEAIGNAVSVLDISKETWAKNPILKAHEEGFAV